MLDRLRQIFQFNQAANQDNQGLLTNQNTQATGGLLGGLTSNPNLLIGAGIIGQGVQGKDPFGSIIPAVTQTAQIQKLLTPKRRGTKSVYNQKTGKTEFATETEIAQNPNLVPVPTGTVTRFNTDTGQVEILPAGMAGQQIKDQTKAKSLSTEYNILSNFIGDMKSRLPETKTGGVGLGYAVAESLADQTAQIAESLGVKDTLVIEDTEAIDKYLKSKGFTEGAKNYATMKSSVTNLGYALAKIAEPDNPRLSEGDIIRQLGRINFGGSREVFSASLDQILKEEGIRAEATIKSLGGDVSIFEPKKKKKKEEGKPEGYDPLGILK
ncbi:hypothetical protein [uncultured Mediterranean phage uvMED]|nr:hypothetical protein [uncultured Mediterranean phage uvMED]BAR18589.1 hypothetical protein [uncultured Mediterranean phage uvMED]BAR18651.1 hypothetical protein [uncultured Mediterranean phage uvMED]BAR18721.1 hypothetical protein [uncultured Mediterranean phage uvMED]BAR18767.1 hypothetical protein [uncultured Mediterranean phage uvMED]